MIELRPRFDAETIIADFLGDLYDGHERVGFLENRYERLRLQAQILMRDLAENGFDLAKPIG